MNSVIFRILLNVFYLTYSTLAGSLPLWMSDSMSTVLPPLKYHTKDSRHDTPFNQSQYTDTGLTSHVSVPYSHGREP